MEKYLYLTKTEWAEAWVSGGAVPISLASTYLHKTRDGILTPDENLIHESPVDLSSLSPGIHMENVKNITMTNIHINGQKVPDVKNGNFYHEDGLILSFCNHFSITTGKKLGKKTCVKIINMEKLRKKIDRQLGCKGIMQECRYTEDHQRNHFLKSNEDSWQDEYRIFWKYPKNKTIKLPYGIAELISEF